MSETLIGRAEELRRLERVIALARNGRGGSLRLTGEPGIGKSALLHAATCDAVEVRTIVVQGFENESAVPFGAVQRLVRPLGELLPKVPRIHEKALREVLHDSGTARDPFRVGLGMLHLLAVAGEESTVVTVVDDCHLLDKESLDALGFVGRRLHAERAALLMAHGGTGDVDGRLDGVEDLELGGLTTRDGLVLLNRPMSEPVDASVGAKVVQALGGNPLALLELGRQLSPRELTDLVLEQDPIPIGRRLEAHYGAQIRQLSPETRTWLLVAAAEATGSPDLILRGAIALGVGARSAAASAQTSGLVVLDPQVRFRHPLVRSAAYGSADPAERRRVHEVLADVSKDLGADERAVWHLAKACDGLDERVAAQLERVGHQLAAGSHSTRARVMRCAARLSPSPADRDRRTVLAAEAAFHAGTPDLARDLLQAVHAVHLSTADQARVLELSANLTAAAGGVDSVTASSQLLAAADLHHHADPLLESRALTRTWELAMTSGGLASDVDWQQLARRLEATADTRAGEPARTQGALAALLGRPTTDCPEVLRDGLDAYLSMGDQDRVELARVALSLATALWDAPGRRAVMDSLATAAPPSETPHQHEAQLSALAEAEIAVGNVHAARLDLDRILELRKSLGRECESALTAGVGAWVEPPEARAALVERARRRGLRDVGSASVVALARVSIAGGDHDSAHALLTSAARHPLFQLTSSWWPDLVEACLRSGHSRCATRTSDAMADLAASCESPWARGASDRCRALIAADNQAESHFNDALAALSDPDIPLLELGRAHLNYGEWLRRQRRRRDAETQLAAAREAFVRIGAGPFVERADTGLRVLHGGQVRLPKPSDQPLTVQELNVARLVSSGLTNAEVASALFISDHTVDYHLRKVFQKLGISSRRQLKEHLGDLAHP